MKLELDTTKKTIKIEEEVKLTKLISVIKRLLPNGEWQDFTLLTNTTINHWSNPIIYKEYWPTSKPWREYPWIISNPIYYTNTNNDSTAYQLKAGTYNIDI